MSDTSTRSGMLWEVERILTELDEKPQVLIMENVPQVHSQDNMKDFHKWQVKLEELGYKNYWQDLSATDYGIPQTRNRCFMVSILGDYSYTFPTPIPLKLKLKDMLEDNVNDNYYLSKKMENYVLSKNETSNFKTFRPHYKGDEKIAHTIQTSGGNRADDNFIIEFVNQFKRVDKVDERYYLSEKGVNYICGNALNKDLKDRIDRNKMKLNKEIAYTISTKQDRRCGDANFILDGYEETTIEDFLKIKENKNVAINKIDIKQKVKVRKYDIDIEKLKKTLKEHKKYSNKEISLKLNVPLTTIEHWFRNDEGFSVPNTNIWFKLKELLDIKTNEFDESITTFIEKDNLYAKSNRCYFDDGLAPTLTATGSDEKIISDLRIRKLTPRECFRLMGVKDEDYENCAKSQTDSSLYHLAGDSIVVNVLMAIFKEMM